MENFKSEYIISNLHKNPEVRIKTLHLIEKSFGYKGDNQYKIDFFPLVCPSNAENNHILIEKESGNVIAHAGALSRFIKTNEMLTPITLFGGMCVDESYHKKGFFRYFFSEILKHYKDKSALMILWSNLTGLYNKFRFYEAGIVYQTGNNTFDDSVIRKFYKKTKFNELNDFEFDSIKFLYSGMSDLGNTMIHRSDNDWEKIKQITSTDLYLHKEDNLINGYFCINKGYDLQDIIHEVVFNEDSKENIISSLSDYKLWAATSFLDEHKGYTPLYTGFFKIGNTERFKDYITHWSKGEVKIIERKENLISYKHFGEPLMDTDDKFLRKVFGPDQFFADCHYGAPLYISGLDSI